MLVYISSIGNHYSLRVYSVGYETTVVVGELAKPYPEKIERKVRLKRGRSITGVLRDHTGNLIANGRVFFIPKGYQTNIVEGIAGTDAHQLPDHVRDTRDGAVAEVRTNENGTFALPTGVAGPRAKLSKGVIVGHVVEGEMDKAIPDVGHNKNLSTKIRVALPPGNYRVQRLRTGPFALVDEQNVELKSGEDTILGWARGDGSSVCGKATWPANMMFVRQQGEASRKLDWTVPYKASVWIAPVGADGKDGKPIDAAKIQADGSFFVPTNLDHGKYKATARVSLPESDDSGRSSRVRVPDCIATAEFTVPDPARSPFGSPPVELEIKMEVGSLCSAKDWSLRRHSGA